MSYLLERESSTPFVSSYPKRSPLGALFSRTLPSYSGQYPVGVHDTELSVHKQSFGHFNHISMPDAEAGLTIDTVMFTLFYPTSSHDKSHQAVWFPRLVVVETARLCVTDIWTDCARQLMVSLRWRSAPPTLFIEP